ncbi:hypothetical protein CMUS01_12708 [Colletotrichum musicola]|uniref:Uncharacterized protein n=1 Tax=Colletotrichum musicola TaxID=2175873 RepID=A0A8H6JIZ0_9PEZI|nr:hypothetical protein CMUS01_12708 [Colletotrichum musicola]
MKKFINMLDGTPRTIKRHAIYALEKSGKAIDKRNVNIVGAERRTSEAEAKVELCMLYKKKRVVPNPNVTTQEEEYASARPKPRKSTKRTISEEVVPMAGHTRWVRSKPVAAEPEENMSDRIYNPRGNSEEYMGYEKEPHKNQSNMAAQAPPQVKDWDREYSEQSAHYIQMGEDVVRAESEPMVTVSRVDRGTRVIWGGTRLTESATWNVFDHWFGPMKHYEHWLGDHKSADIFIRMDKAAPEGLGLISLPQLQAVLDQAQLRRKKLASIMAKEVATKDQQFSNSLRAVAAMNSLYAGLKGATVDVRILSRAIEDTH